MREVGMAIIGVVTSEIVRELRVRDRLMNGLKSLDTGALSTEAV